MQPATFTLPLEMPKFGQFSQVMNAENNNLQNAYNQELQNPAKFHPYYDWEFFMSELEYE